MNDRRTFLKGVGCVGAAAFAKIGTAATGSSGKIIDFDSPLSVCIRSDGKWRNVKDEVSVSGGIIRLKTDKASWIRLTWNASFSKDALVLCDAWERAYGDLCWRPIGIAEYSPWYFSVRDGGLTRCLGVKTGPAALCSWSIDCNSVSLLMDVRCGCLDTLFDGRAVVLAELVQTDGADDPWDVIHGFCKMMCPEPKLPTAPFYGGDDWYSYYSDTSFERTLDHAKILSECARGLRNRPYQTVDAGWQLCHNWYLNDEYIGGPYRYANNKFKDMRKMADAIRALDVRPGLWIRPLETVEYVSRDAYLRRNKAVKYLDPTHPEAREILDGDIRTFVDWGYEMIKWDFPVVDMFRRYGSAMTESVCEGDWSFYDRHRTSAEISLEYYRGVAKLAQGVLVNCCNTFSHLTAGVFMSNRIGDDTSGNDWSRTVKYGVNTLAFRAMQHRAMYSVDPDCVGITEKIPWRQNREWLNLLKYSGTSMLVSVDRKCYTHEVRDAIAEAFALGSELHETARPLDWDETLTPRRWKTFDGVKEFNWD